MFGKYIGMGECGHESIFLEGIVGLQRLHGIILGTEKGNV